MVVVRASMTWTGGLRFEGTSAFGHQIVTDCSRKAGGQESGYQPSELLLFGIIGCTGIDVVRILEKQNQNLTALDIMLQAHQNEQYPKPFHTIEVNFRFHGRDLDPGKVARAIELSEERYCVVSQTVRIPGKVVTNFEIVEA